MLPLPQSNKPSLSTSMCSRPISERAGFNVDVFESHPACRHLGNLGLISDVWVVDMNPLLASTKERETLQHSRVITKNVAQEAHSRRIEAHRPRCRRNGVDAVEL